MQTLIVLCNMWQRFVSPDTSSRAPLESTQKDILLDEDIKGVIKCRGREEKVEEPLVQSELD